MGGERAQNAGRNKPRESGRQNELGAPARPAQGCVRWAPGPGSFWRSTQPRGAGRSGSTWRIEAQSWCGRGCWVDLENPRLLAGGFKASRGVQSSRAGLRSVDRVERGLPRPRGCIDRRSPLPASTRIDRVP